MEREVNRRIDRKLIEDREIIWVFFLNLVRLILESAVRFLNPISFLMVGKGQALKPTQGTHLKIEDS